MHNQFPLFKSPLQAYLLEQPSHNYFPLSLSEPCLPGTRSRQCLARDTWLGWTHIHISSFAQSRPVPFLYTPPTRPPSHHPFTSPLLLFLSFDTASRLSVALSILSLCTLFQISPGCQLRHVTWRACDYSSWQPYSFLRNNPKNTLINRMAEKHKVSMESDSNARDNPGWGYIHILIWRRHIFNNNNRCPQEFWVSISFDPCLHQQAWKRRSRDHSHTPGQCKQGLL